MVEFWPISSQPLLVYWRGLIVKSLLPDFTFMESTVVPPLGHGRTQKTLELHKNISSSGFQKNISNKKQEGILRFESLRTE